MVPTQLLARTMGVDPKTKNLYLLTAEFGDGSEWRSDGVFFAEDETGFFHRACCESAVARCKRKDKSDGNRELGTARAEARRQSTAYSVRATSCASRHRQEKKGNGNHNLARQKPNKRKSATTPPSTLHARALRGSYYWRNSPFLGAKSSIRASRWLLFEVRGPEEDRPLLSSRIKCGDVFLVTLREAWGERGGVPVHEELCRELHHHD
jgi:hypothetical protein